MAVDYDLGTARGRIEIDSSQLGRTSQALRSFGLATTAAGLAAVAAFGFVVKSAASFEKSMDAVAAVSGASRREMALLSEQALDLSTKSVFSANEISGAMQALAKAGIPVQDMLNGATEATIHLAAAAGDELPGGVEQAAVVIANAQKTFNASAKDLEHFADVLVAAAASSTISVDDLAVSMKYAGPIAHELGLSIDDLSTILAVLGDRGIRGSIAGTSLRGVLLGLTPTSEKATNAMKKLGLITKDGANQFYDLHGNLKPIPEVMQILQDSTKGLSEQQKVQAFNTIFQRRAMNAALILAGQGAKGFDKYAKAIAGLDASDIAAKKLDNLSGDMTILRNNIDALIKRAGLPLQDFLRNIVQGITKFLQKLNDLDPKVLSIIVSIVGAIGVFLVLIGTAALVGSALIRMYRTFVVLGESVKLLAAAFKLLSVSLLTNPVFLIIAAIIALGVAIYLAYRRSETFRKAWDKLFEDLRPIFNKIGAFFTNLGTQLKNLWDVFRSGDDVAQGSAEVIDNMFGNTGKLVEPVRTLVTALIYLKNAAVAAFDYFADHVLPTMIEVGRAIVSGIGVGIEWLAHTGIPAVVRFGRAVGNVSSEVYSWLAERLGPVFTAFGELVAGVASRIVDVWNLIFPVFRFFGGQLLAVFKFVQGLFDDFVQAVLTIWTYFGDNIIEQIRNVFNLVKSVVSAALQIIRGIIEIVTGIITLKWTKVWQGIKDVFGGVWNAIYAIVKFQIQQVRLIIENVVDAIVALWKIAWDLVGAVIIETWNFMWATVKNFIGLIKSHIQATLSAIHGIWSRLWTAIKTVVTTVWNAIKNVVSSAALAVYQFVVNKVNQIKSYWSVAWNNVLSFIRNVWALIKGAVSQGISNVVALAKALPGKVLSAIGNLAKTLYQKGVDLIQGFINGIKDKAKDIGGVINKAFGGIPGKIGGLLGIGSPSKHTIYFGKMMVKGLSEGLKDMVDIGKFLDKTLSPSALLPTPAAISGGSTVNLTLEFPNVGSAKDVEDIERALGDSDVLSQLIHSVRAGVGRR